jgi:hypothetical protein
VLPAVFFYFFISYGTGGGSSISLVPGFIRDVAGCRVVRHIHWCGFAGKQLCVLEALP